jgi:hypothetical protein
MVTNVTSPGSTPGIDLNKIGMTEAGAIRPIEVMAVTTIIVKKMYQRKLEYPVSVIVFLLLLDN